jgi:protein TonB
MFKSVIERQRAGRLGTGVWVSTGVHAALLAAVLFVSARRPQPVPEPEPRLPRFPRIHSQQVDLQPPGTQPAPTPPKHAATQPPRRKRELAPPKQVQPLPPEAVMPAEPEPEPAPSGTEELASTGGDGPVGSPTGVSTGLGSPPGPNHIDPGGGGSGMDIEPFGAGMTPPAMVGGPAIEYTPQALVAGVQGTMLVKCVITVEGQVRDCRVIKGLPHMDAAVMDALEGRHYRPVTFQGKAVSVSYVFTVRLKLP